MLVPLSLALNFLNRLIECFLMFNNYQLVCISIQIIASSVKGNINTCTQPTIRFTAKYGISQLYPNGHLFLTMKYKIWRCSQTVIYLISFGQAVVFLSWSFDHYHNYQAPIAKWLKTIDCKRNQTLIRMAYCLLLPHFIVTSPKCAFY